MAGLLGDRDPWQAPSPEATPGSAESLRTGNAGWKPNTMTNPQPTVQAPCNHHHHNDDDDHDHDNKEGDDDDGDGSDEWSDGNALDGDGACDDEYSANDD